MRAGTILFLIILLTSYASKPKFRYLDIYVPVYINVNSLPRDADDEVSKFLKDTLTKISAKLVSYTQHSQLVKQYLDDVNENLKRLSAEEKTNISSFRNIWIKGTPSQSYNIQYTSLTDQKATIESCDSIGFSFLALPFKSIDQKPIRQMWHIKEVASRSNDSIALFLLKRM